MRCTHLATAAALLLLVAWLPGDTRGASPPEAHDGSAAHTGSATTAAPDAPHPKFAGPMEAATEAILQLQADVARARDEAATCSQRLAHLLELQQQIPGQQEEQKQQHQQQKHSSVETCREAVGCLKDSPEVYIDAASETLPEPAQTPGAPAPSDEHGDFFGDDSHSRFVRSLAYIASSGTALACYGLLDRRVWGLFRLKPIEWRGVGVAFGVLAMIIAVYVTARCNLPMVDVLSRPLTHFYK